jgi:hypothetical protein
MLIIFSGNNKNAVIEMLSLRSTAQRQTIMTKYKETHKKVRIVSLQYSSLWRFKKLDKCENKELMRLNV